MRHSYQKAAQNYEIQIPCAITGENLAMGYAFIVDESVSTPEDIRIDPAQRAEELEKYQQATQSVDAHYAQLLEDADRHFSPSTARHVKGMLSSERLFTNDPGAAKAITADIQSGTSALRAIYNFYQPRIDEISNFQNDKLRGMAHALESVAKALMVAVSPKTAGAELHDVPEGSIPVVEYIPVGKLHHIFDTHGNPRVPGLLMEKGTGKDHTNIVAGGAGVVIARKPAEERPEIQNGDLVIIDGQTGHIILNPQPDTIQQYQDKIRKQDKLLSVLKMRAANEEHLARTVDGQAIHVAANIAAPENIEACTDHSADSIGLYRTELAIENEGGIPTQSRWEDIFTDVLAQNKNGSVTIRTVDFDGDKAVPGVESEQDRKDITRTQIAALLQVQQKLGTDKIRIMIPVIKDSVHLADFQEIMNEEAIKAGVVPIKLGAMVEVPSFVEDLDQADAAFYSIGTNDLIANTLRYDRYAEDDENQYDPTHPKVLQALRKTAEAGRAQNVGVCVCGDMASDPLYFALLAGTGIRKLSTGPSKIPLIKELVRRIDTFKAEKLVDALIAEPSRAERTRMLQDFNDAELDLGEKGLRLEHSARKGHNAANSNFKPS